jgi:hypothetical protein
MMTRNEIIEMLMAASRESHLCGRFDVRAIAEGFADQLLSIDAEHRRQIARAKRPCLTQGSTRRNARWLS